MYAGLAYILQPVRMCSTVSGASLQSLHLGLCLPTFPTSKDQGSFTLLLIVKIMSARCEVVDVIAGSTNPAVIVAYNTAA